MANIRKRLHITGLAIPLITLISLLAQFLTSITVHSLQSVPKTFLERHYLSNSLPYQFIQTVLETSSPILIVFRKRKLLEECSRVLEIPHFFTFLFSLSKVTA